MKTKGFWKIWLALLCVRYSVRFWKLENTSFSMNNDEFSRGAPKENLDPSRYDNYGGPRTLGCFMENEKFKRLKGRATFWMCLLTTWTWFLRLTKSGTVTSAASPRFGVSWFWGWISVDGSFSEGKGMMDNESVRLDGAIAAESWQFQHFILIQVLRPSWSWAIKIFSESYIYYYIYIYIYIYI